MSTKIGPDEDAWLRENDQTHRLGLNSTSFFTVRIDLHLQIQLQVQLFLNIRMVGRKEAAAAVGTRRTWAFRGGPGASLIWEIGAHFPETTQLDCPSVNTPGPAPGANRPSARRGSRAAPRARLDSPRTHTAHATQTGIRRSTDRARSHPFV